MDPFKTLDLFSKTMLQSGLDEIYDCILPFLSLQ